MRSAARLMHPLHVLVILTALVCGFVMFGGGGLAVLSGEAAKIATGTLLIAAMTYQAKLLFMKLMRRPMDRQDQARHRAFSYASVVLFLLHLSGPATTWNLFLLITFMLTTVTAMFSRSIVKPHSRGAILWQVFLHTAFGAMALAAAIPHAIMALAFE